MNRRVICHNHRPSSRHSAPRTPRAKVSHPACPECGTPVTTLRRNRDQRGGLVYRVMCDNCCRFWIASLRITNDLNPSLCHAQHDTARDDGYLACTYCAHPLRTYSGRRASDYSTERYLRCSNASCGHVFKGVYEFNSQVRPDPACRATNEAPLKTEYVHYDAYPQLELSLTT